MRVAIYRQLSHLCVAKSCLCIAINPSSLVEMCASLFRECNSTGFQEKDIERCTHYSQFWVRSIITTYGNNPMVSVDFAPSIPQNGK